MRKKVVFCQVVVVSPAKSMYICVENHNQIEVSQLMNLNF
jgi:hypothetical protein